MLSGENFKNFSVTSQKFQINNYIQTIKLFNKNFSGVAVVVGVWWCLCDVFIQTLFMCIYYVYVCTIYIKYTYFMHILWCFVVFYALYMQYIHIHFTAQKFS